MIKLIRYRLKVSNADVATFKNPKSEALTSQAHDSLYSRTSWVIVKIARFEQKIRNFFIDIAYIMSLND